MEDTKGKKSGTLAGRLVAALKGSPIVRTMMADPLLFELTPAELVLGAAYLGGRQVRGVPDVFATASEASAKAAWQEVCVSLPQRGYATLGEKGQLVLDPNLADILRCAGAPRRSLGAMLALNNQPQRQLFLVAANRRFAGFMPQDNAYRLMLFPSAAAGIKALRDFLPLGDSPVGEVGLLHRSALVLLQKAVADADAQVIGQITSKLKSPQVVTQSLGDAQGTVLIEELSFDGEGQLLGQSLQEIIVSPKAPLRLSVLRQGADPLYRVSGWRVAGFSREAEIFLAG